MGSPRTRLVEKMAALSSGSMRVLDARTGWPSLVEVVAEGATLRVSLHAGTVGLTHRDRDDIERRYQNPESCDPIVALRGTRALLLGLWTQEGVPVFVAHDAERRLGHGGTRVSLFVSLFALRTAASLGWAEHTGSTGERILAFAAGLFPVFATMFVNGVMPSEEQTRTMLHAAAAAPDDPASIERARRAALVLVRDARFKTNIIKAYGPACAICGLGIVEGAHIYPASAPGSEDVVENGLALCPNHHAVFDRHLLWIDPRSFRVVAHPDLAARVGSTQAGSALLASCAGQLRFPSRHAVRPSEVWLRARYAHFGDAYSWAPD